MKTKSQRRRQTLKHLPIHPQVPQVGGEEKNGIWLLYLVAGTYDIQQTLNRQ